MTLRRRQRGAALLLLLVIAVIAFITAVLGGFGKWATPTTSRRNVNGEVLAQAKAALIGYVAKKAMDLSEDTPGRFPCPESLADAGTSGEGITATPTCTPTASQNKTLGRLPWRTLGIDKLVDADGEPLWYAVSRNWVSGPSLSTINPGTAGQLSFDGTANVVAIIFAPGRAISTTPTAAQLAAGCVARNQLRNDRSHVSTSAVNPDYRDYLECQNATSPIDDVFGVAVAGNETTPVINDQAVVITDKEILNAIQGPLAERMQRTVAPLLSEHAAKWVGASGRNFLPYAVSFASAPSPETTTVNCGTASVREGILPTALTTTPGCSSAWRNFSISGTDNSVLSQGCTTSTGVTCTFQYYNLNLLGGVLNIALNLTGLSSLVGNIGNAGTITATVTADAPNAGVSFRDPLATSSIVVNNPTGPALSHTMSLTPKTTGEASLTIQIPITSGTNNLCTSLVDVVCNLLPGLLATSHTVTVQFPQLADATVDGTQLTSAVFPSPHTLNLLSPADGEPHYWFFSNEWYRYTYYAVARTTSAPPGTGFLTVSGFPDPNNDKMFVLVMMGPAVVSQNSRPSTSLGQYLEGENASTGDDTFAYQVFTASGNDRIAACPYTNGASICY